MFSFKALIACAIFTGSAYAQACSEAERFGILTISPQPIVLGQEVTIDADFTCSFFEEITPVFTDYTLVVPASNNTGFQPPVYFARRNAPSGDTDSFTVTFDPNYFDSFTNAQYEIVLSTTYSVLSDSFGETLVIGNAQFPVSLVQA